MQYYLAPMEGLTTYIFRSTYQKYFRAFDKYFTPFISSRRLNRRERDEILPEHNEGMTVIPQILTNKADEFLAIASQLSSFGYNTVNLNLGCPSGTVAAKKRGAGFLGVPRELDLFLQEIFEKSPLKISIKTRIGICSEEEWEPLLSIFKKYPAEELIIHPRLLKEQYLGTPHISACLTAAEYLSVPLCYNGDINDRTDQEHLLKKAPFVSRIMIGRGILAHPGLISGPADKALLRTFHDDLYLAYQNRMSGETPVLYKMKDLWTYMSASFVHPEKYLKKIRKANRFPDYEAAVDTLFSCEELTLYETLHKEGIEPQTDTAKDSLIAL